MSGDGIPDRRRWLVSARDRPFRWRWCFGLHAAAAGLVRAVGLLRVGEGRDRLNPDLAEENIDRNEADPAIGGAAVVVMDDVDVGVDDLGGDDGEDVDGAGDGGEERLAVEGGAAGGEAHAGLEGGGDLVVGLERALLEGIVGKDPFLAIVERDHVVGKDDRDAGRVEDAPAGRRKLVRRPMGPR